MKKYISDTSLKAAALALVINFIFVVGYIYYKNSGITVLEGSYIGYLSLFISSTLISRKYGQVQLVQTSYLFYWINLFINNIELVRSAYLSSTLTALLLFTIPPIPGLVFVLLGNIVGLKLSKTK